MIKNLLDADEELSSKEKITVENEAKEQIEEQPLSVPQIVEEQPVIVENKEAFEIPEESSFFKKQPETIEEIFNQLESAQTDFDKEILEELQSEQQSVAEENVIAEPIFEENQVVETALPETETFIAENTIESNENETALIQVQPSEFKPPSKAETIRQSGLAWSAGVIFFGSIVFMLILGWFADLLLGTSPWGIVIGIVLGSIIGFIQFFRITSQIFKNK